MNKLLSNRYVVASLAVLAFGFVGWNLFRPLFSRLRLRFATPAPAAQPATRVTPSAAVTSTPDSSTNFPGIDLALIQTRLAEWTEAPARDPFEVYLARQAGPSGPRAADLLSLQAIWRQTGDRLAVINKTVVGEGDHILGFQVDRIEGDVVWVHGTNGTERIQFPVPAGSEPIDTVTPAASRPAGQPLSS